MKITRGDWLMVAIILFLAIANAAIIFIVNVVSDKHSAEKYTQRYLEKIGYTSVEIGAFTPVGCECEKNGGYQFKATNVYGKAVMRKACANGMRAFVIYEVYNCNQITEEY